MISNSADYGVVTVPYKANNQVDDEELTKRIREVYRPGMQGMAVCTEKGEFLTYITLDQVNTMMGKCFGEGVLFQGPYGIVLTPFLNNGKVDYEELGRQLENACKTSITGLVVCGSTGEFTYLSMDEMKEIMAFSKKVIAGRKEFICGATSPSTHHTLELLRYIEELGADGALVAPPFYFPLSDSDVLDFYTAIATAPGNLPIVAYQIPQCTSGISMSVFQELLKLPRIKGLKNSSGNCLQIMQQIDLRNELRKDFAVLTGSDESIYALVNCGANGSFTAIGYLYPELVSNVYRHLKDEEGLYYQHIVVKLATLAGKITYPLGYRMLGEASGKMNFGKYLQAVSEERMKGYEGVKRQMQEVLREYENGIGR